MAEQQNIYRENIAQTVYFDRRMLDLDEGL